MMIDPERVAEALTTPVFVRNYGWTRKAVGNKRLSDWFDAIDRSIYMAKKLNRRVDPVTDRGIKQSDDFKMIRVKRAQRWVRANSGKLPMGSMAKDLVRAAPGHIKPTLTAMLKTKEAAAKT